MSEYCFCNGKRSFIQSGRFAGDSGSGHDHISICLQCGKIHVVGSRNGEHFHISFHVYMPDQLAAIGQFAKSIEQEISDSLISRGDINEH